MPKDSSALSEYKGLLLDRINAIASKRMEPTTVNKCCSQPNSALISEKYQRRHLSFCLMKLNQNLHSTLKADWTIQENSAGNGKDAARKSVDPSERHMRLLKVKKMKSMQMSKSKILLKQMQRLNDGNSLPKIFTQRLGVQKENNIDIPVNEKRINPHIEEKKAVQKSDKLLARHVKSYSNVASLHGAQCEKLEIANLYEELNVSLKESLMLRPKISVMSKFFGLKLAVKSPSFIGLDSAIECLKRIL
eukprot:TRINITY_DN6564_c0_g1_i9.p1 TRINITY_DN6564_c0_g1~~TRINITY_DN6564_c0_g1_i9.p1  ORF type:complete len:248 (+),score=44.91 TRINITY_DN6564_c0_g1_i9:594-1337(+)